MKSTTNLDLSPESKLGEGYVFLFIFGMVFTLVLMIVDKLDHRFRLGIMKKINKNKIKDTLERLEEKRLQEEQLHHAKKNALSSVAITSSKRWDEGQDAYYDEKQLAALLRLIEEDFADFSPLSGCGKEEIEEEESNNKKADYPTAVKLRKPKFVRQLQPATRQTNSDRLLTWNDQLPSYNLTTRAPADENRPVYRLSSGTRYVFINRLLSTYLKLNDPVALTALTTLCERGKDMLPQHSRGQSGFIVKADQSSQRVVEGAKTGKAKKKLEAHKMIKYDRYFIKGKNCNIDQRFFGASVGAQKEGSLFEINGYRQRHKDKSVIYFPSEASSLKKTM